MEISRYQTDVSLILVGIRQGLYTQSNVTLLRVNPILIPMRVGLVRVCTTNSTGTDAHAIQDADLVSSFNLLQNTVTASVCLSICVWSTQHCRRPVSCLSHWHAVWKYCPLSSLLVALRLCNIRDYVGLLSLSLHACLLALLLFRHTQRRVNASATRTHPSPALLYTV